MSLIRYTPYLMGNMQQQVNRMFDQFDGEFTTLFALEDAISDEVADALAQRLSGDQPRLAVVPDRTRSTARRSS